MPNHPHIGPAILCSCPACTTSRLDAGRRVFALGPGEGPDLDQDYDKIGAYRRIEWGE